MIRAQAAERFIMEKVPKSPLEQAATSPAPVLESSPAFLVNDAKGSQETDESRPLPYEVKNKSFAGGQKPAVSQPQMSRAESPARLDVEETGRLRGDGEGEPVEREHEVSTVGSSMEFEDDRFPGWQEPLDFMELSKSRLLEDESALRLLKSLEPRAIEESNWFFEPHTLFLSLARMSNVSET